MFMNSKNVLLFFECYYKKEQLTDIRPTVHSFIYIKMNIVGSTSE